MSSHIRNIAIIAHVDHGKTTLVDQLLRQGGTYRENQAVEERVMDSMDLEREKGITIKAKNTSVHWNNYVVNIVDTPGHADFGGEVERVMKMVDGVLLLVDAYDGPQAQTRFVLRKALNEGLRVVVVVNKIDRENSDPEAVHEKVLELFMDLDANEEQFNSPFVYASGKTGFAIHNLEDERTNMIPLFETILEHIPPPVSYPDEPFRMLVSNIEWNDFVGRVAVGKVLSGRTEVGQTLYRLRKDGTKQQGKVTKILEYTGVSSSDAPAGVAGDIVGISGFEEVDIGETLTADANLPALPFVELDPPTIRMEFAINDGPLAGQDGKKVTSRQVRERLMQEIRTNISIQIEDGESAGTFVINARGAMQIAVLVEQMRREGFEILVSRPTVITQQIDGVTMEPIETLWVEIPEDRMGGVMKNIANRRGRIDSIDTKNQTVILEGIIPTRGLIGFEFDLMNLTSGRGIFSHLFKEYGPYTGEFATRQTGTLVAVERGTSTAYALAALEDRGKLFISGGVEVYEGMIVGENPRQEDMPVNPCKAKQLTNFRSQGEGKGIQLTPPLEFTLERALEYIANDEYVEATPKTLRLRKKILNTTERNRAKKRAE